MYAATMIDHTARMRWLAEGTCTCLRRFFVGWPSYAQNSTLTGASFDILRTYRRCIVRSCSKSGEETFHRRDFIPGTTTLSFTSRGKSRACSLTCIQRNLQFFPWNTDCTDSTRKLPPALDYGKFWSKISPRWRGFIYECDNVERCCISALSTEIFFRMEVRTRVSPLFFIFIKHTYIRQRKR